MRLIVERDAVLDAVERVRGAVARGANTIPILQTVLLSAGDGRLTVVGNDTTKEATAIAAAEVAEPGQAATPGEQLHSLLRSLSVGSQVELSLGEKGFRLTVKSGRSRFVLPCLPAADFPTMARGAATHTATLPAKALARLIDKAAFCASDEETRFYLCGLHLHVADVDGMKRLRVVATDGARLAYAETECPSGWETAPPLTVPNKSLAEILRLVDDEGGASEIWVAKGLFGVKLGGAELVTKLVDGNFPDYPRVIPKGHSHQVVVDVEGLSATLRRCALMATDKERTIRVSIGPDGIAVKSRDVVAGGEAEDLVEATLEGDPLEVSLNVAFLTEIVGKMRGETLRLEMGAKTDPLKLIDPTDEAGLYILMPLRTS